MDTAMHTPSTKQVAYVDALLRYFENQTPQLRVVVEEKIESFSAEFEDPQIAYDQFLVVIKKLERNDFETWTEFQKEVTRVFNNDTEMKELFLTVATKRSIPSLRFTA